MIIGSWFKLYYILIKIYCMYTQKKLLGPSRNQRKKTSHIVVSHLAWRTILCSRKYLYPRERLHFYNCLKTKPQTFRNVCLWSQMQYHIISLQIQWLFMNTILVVCLHCGWVDGLCTCVYCMNMCVRDGLHIHQCSQTDKWCDFQQHGY